MDSFIDEILVSANRGASVRPERPRSLPPPRDAREVGRAFFRSLRSELGDHPAMCHPFLVRFAEGPLDREQIQRFAIQHYMYSALFVRNLAAVLSNTPDEAVRAAIIHNLYDEIGAPSREAAFAPDRSHPALFRRFLAALHIDGARVAATGALPETARFIRTYEDLCRTGHWLEALGAMACGTECLVPHLYGFIHLGLERSRLLLPEDYEFWTLHIGGDDEHGDRMVQSLVPLAASPDDQLRITLGARRALDARQDWFDGLHRLVFGDEAPDTRRLLPPARGAGGPS